MIKKFYSNERYKKFLKSLYSYEQKTEFIELIGEAIQYGIAMLSCNLKNNKKKG